MQIRSLYYIYPMNKLFVYYIRKPIKLFNIFRHELPFFGSALCTVLPHYIIDKVYIKQGYI